MKIGQNIAIGIAEETVYKTPVSPPTHWLNHTGDGSLDKKPEIKMSNAITGYANARHAAIGANSVTGGITVEASAELLPVFLKGALGNIATVDNLDGTYTHTFRVNDTTSYYSDYYLPSFTIEENTDGIAQRTAGAKIENLKLSANVGDFVTAEATIKAVSKEAMGTPSTVVYPDIAPLMFLTGSVYEGAAATAGSADLTPPVGLNVLADIKSFDLEIANTFGENRTISSGADVNEHKRTKNEIKLTAKLVFNDIDMYNDYISGTQKRFWLKLAFGNDIVVFDLPNVILDEVNIPRGKEELEQDITATALAPSTAPADVIVASVLNTIAAY